jgi:hypothetical protein
MKTAEASPAFVSPIVNLDGFILLLWFVKGKRGASDELIHH